MTKGFRKGQGHFEHDDNETRRSSCSVVVVLVEHLAGIGLGDGVPALPGDAEDDGGDDEANDRIGQVEPERNDRGAGEHSETDEAVDAGVVSVCDERGALQPSAGA